MISHALLTVGGQVHGLPVDSGVGYAQRTQLCQFDHAAGGRGRQNAGVKNAVGHHQQLELFIRGVHDLHSGQVHSRTVAGSRIGTGRGQAGTADPQPDKLGASGNQNLIGTVKPFCIQTVGMTKVAEIVSAGGSVGHGGFRAGGSGDSDDGTGIIRAVDLGAVSVGAAVQGHTLHTVAAALIGNGGQRFVAGVMLLGQICCRIHSPGGQGQQRSTERQTQAQAQQPFDCSLHNAFSFVKFLL